MYLTSHHARQKLERDGRWTTGRTPERPWPRAEPVRSPCPARFQVAQCRKHTPRRADPLCVLV